MSSSLYSLLKMFDFTIILLVCFLLWRYAFPLFIMATVVYFLPGKMNTYFSVKSSLNACFLLSAFLSLYRLLLNKTFYFIKWSSFIPLINPDLSSMYALGCMNVILQSVDISCECFGQMVVPEKKSGGHPKRWDSFSCSMNILSKRHVKIF